MCSETQLVGGSLLSSSTFSIIFQVICWHCGCEVNNKSALEEAGWEPVQELGRVGEGWLRY